MLVAHGDIKVFVVKFSGKESFAPNDMRPDHTVPP